MRKILIDEQLLSKLHNLTEVVELCDQTGRIVAKVIPSLPTYDPDKWDPAIPPPLSAEEAARRRKGPTHTIAQVLEHLRKL